MHRPLLFVDIDGVLNPNCGPLPEGFQTHWLFPDNDEPVRVCQAHSGWLYELAEQYDLTWATSWTPEDRAVLATVLDLPPFTAAADIPPGKIEPAKKVPAVHDVAGDRALAWIDDMLTPEAFAWAASRGAPTLLVPIDPVSGLTRARVDQLIAWSSEA